MPRLATKISAGSIVLIYPSRQMSPESLHIMKDVIDGVIDIGGTCCIVDQQLEMVVLEV